MTNTQILGEKELNAVLMSLPVQVRKRLTIAGMRKAAAPMRSMARQLAPRKTGTTKKAIQIVVNKKGFKPEIWVAPTKGRHVAYDAWYSRFHEFGTRGHGKRTRSKGVTVAYARRGTGLPAIRFMQRAFEAKNDEVRSRITDEISIKTVNYLRKKVPRFYVN